MRAAVSVLIGMPETWRVSTAMPWSVGRSSFTLWWARRAPPSARIWPSCSYRQGSWGGTVTAVIKYLELRRVDKMFLMFFLSEPGEAPCITSAGFQFLLLDTASQLWYFTLQYLKTAQVVISGYMLVKYIVGEWLWWYARFDGRKERNVASGLWKCLYNLYLTVERYGPGGDSFLFVPAEFFHSRSGEFCF